MLYLMSESRHPKKTPSGDWSRKYVLYRLDLAGWSMSGLSLEHYPTRDVLKTALDRPWLKGERIIAGAIGVAPSEIWPSRYTAKSSANRRRLAA